MAYRSLGNFDPYLAPRDWYPADPQEYDCDCVSGEACDCAEQEQERQEAAAEEAAEARAEYRRYGY